MLLVALYVNDIIFLGNNGQMIEEFKDTMTREFEMTDLGLMRFFLGLEVRQEETRILISHEKYAKEILKKYKIESCNPISTPMKPGAKLSKFDGGERVEASKYRSLVGSLRYLTCIRIEDYKLVGYSDNDWCGDINDRKSTSGYVFYMGNTAFTWLSKKQPIVTLSTCEAEYVATSWCVCHAIWLRRLLSKMKWKDKESVVVGRPRDSGLLIVSICGWSCGLKDGPLEIVGWLKRNKVAGFMLFSDGVWSRFCDVFGGFACVHGEWERLPAKTEGGKGVMVQLG
ncbi:uncharacterized mitochondrial protein AtMg00810-like [Lathyrus oleraceus]|uniref:uncharacterized mitochondrial protein AtMg00810-like n=1 Tax=Pisum sativum TaxID=3888 RepID=UPI0021D262AE|nr:uncharacterized mitochondrial protein AtMg00810-like [Pisum sativum]